MARIEFSVNVDDLEKVADAIRQEEPEDIKATLVVWADTNKLDSIIKKAKEAGATAFGS